MILTGNKVLRAARFFILIAATATIAGCSVKPDGVDIHDPYEAANRKRHEFNKGLDRALLRPVANTYDAVLPDPIETSVSSFAANLSLPGKVVNSLLQLNLKDAGKNTLRFAINTTAGIGGLFDASTVMGLPEEDTDFGETLSVWGVNEGAYLEVPVLGPRTERDLAGFVVDMVLDPLSYVIGKPQSDYRSIARAGEILQTRHSLGSEFDATLYDSADSYAQLRSLYLQNRKFNLGGAVNDVTDPYLDPYDQFE